MNFIKNVKYYVKFPLPEGMQLGFEDADCPRLTKGSYFTVIRYNIGETYPYFIQFSNGHKDAFTYTELFNLVYWSNSEDKKEENKMSNINVNITYVVTGYDDEVYTLYAGYDEEKANASTNDAVHLEDFHKEVWYDGKLVRKSFKMLNTSDWVEQEDKFKDVLMNAKHHAEKLEDNLKILDGIKVLLKPEDKNHSVETYTEISNHLNTIKHLMTVLQGY